MSTLRQWWRARRYKRALAAYVRVNVNAEPAADPSMVADLTARKIALAVAPTAREQRALLLGVLRNLKARHPEMAATLDGYIRILNMRPGEA